LLIEYTAPAASFPLRFSAPGPPASDGSPLGAVAAVGSVAQAARPRAPSATNERCLVTGYFL
jgi:hypothetical protein